MIIAGIVTFNPNIDRLKENIDSVHKQVDLVYVVDNGSNNSEILENITSSYNNVSLKLLEKNYGIAKALNAIFAHAKMLSAEWVLTLDQDSVITDNFITICNPYLNEPQYNSLCTLRKDRKAEVANSSFNSDITELTFCITSGNLVRVSAWEKVGGFNEDLFIDMVDFEFCYKFLDAGYKIHRINKEGLLHDLGSPTYKRFLWKQVIVYNHSAFRKYYIIRNGLAVIRKYPIYSKKNTLHKLVFRTFIFTILYEDNKREKIKKMIDGYRDSKKLLL